MLLKKWVDKVKQEPIIFLYRKMWKMAEGNRGRIALYLFMFLLANLVLLLQPWIYGQFLNEIQQKGLSGENLKYLLFLLFSFSITETLFWSLWGPARLIEEYTAFKTNVNYRKYLLGGTMNLSLAWHSNRDSGDTIDRINKANDGLFTFSKTSFFMLSGIIKGVGTLVILFYYNFNLASITLFILCVSLYVIYRFDLKLVPQWKALNEYDNKISAKIFDTISNIVTVKVLHIENPVTANIVKSLQQPWELFKKNRIVNELKWGTGSVLFSTLVVIPLSVYIYYLYKNNIAFEIGTFSALYLYLTRLNDVFFASAGAYNDMLINKSRVKNVEDIEADIEQNKKVDRKKVPHFDKISLNNIIFQYDETLDSPTVNNLSFEFYKGEKIAFIGESGSGKTTFLKVLHGLYSDASAQITFYNAGKEVKTQTTNFANIDLKTTLVPQEPEVFSASIRENITLAVDYKDEEIEIANALAQFTNVVEQLPKGLESVVNEKGVNLSGGQKQRLALSRALLFAKEKEIILLDESTSSVDPENEVKIYHNIFNHFKGKTILASIHKMNLLKYFDRIIIMDKGKIIDEGSFEQLLMTNQQFKNSWEEYIKNNSEE